MRRRGGMAGHGSPVTAQVPGGSFVVAVFAHRRQTPGGLAQRPGEVNCADMGRR